MKLYERGKRYKLKLKEKDKELNQLKNEFRNIVDTRNDEII